MKYNSFIELQNAYDNIPVDEMSFEDELSYRIDCFDTYEGIGFTDTFNSPYEDMSKFNGKPFKVVRRMSYTEDNIDLECLPKWIISIDGEEIEAYPEEICKAGKDSIYSCENYEAENDEMEKSALFKDFVKIVKSSPYEQVISVAEDAEEREGWWSIVKLNIADAKTLLCNYWGGGYPYAYSIDETEDIETVEYALASFFKDAFNVTVDDDMLVAFHIGSGSEGKEDEDDEEDEDEWLVCERCGYKQYDEQTIRSYKEKYPDTDAHDIPYVCGACMDTEEDDEAI